MANEGKRTSRGRQKREIKKIENEGDLLVTFSKRKSGIYKKASDMLTLCGGEVGIVIFSPSGKPYSFGHPTIDSVINRFENKVPAGHNNHIHQLTEAFRRMRIEELVRQNNELLNQLEGVKEQQKSLQQAGTKTKREWWNTPVDELGLKELDEIYTSMVELEKAINNILYERREAFFASQGWKVGKRPRSDPNIMNPIGAGSFAFRHGFGFGGLGH